MSPIVVDTHIVIWDQLDPSRLTAKAKKAIASADENHQIFICEISLWEISILMKKKRLIIDIPYLNFIQNLLHTRNYVLQGINPEIALLATEMEMDTRDPADRLIAATAIHFGVPLITSDQMIRNNKDLKIIWQ
jgi:PIN domain nuclease of toxin-antitoxin system